MKMNVCFRKSSFVVCIFIVGAIFGCTKSPATQILVSVATNFQIPHEIDEIQVQVAQNETQHASFPIYLDPSQDPQNYATLPGTFVIVGGDQLADPVKITLSGKRNSTTVVERVALLPFAKEQTLLLRMNLLQSCATTAIACGDGFTCGESGCRSPAYEPGDVSAISEQDALKEPALNVVNVGPKHDSGVVVPDSSLDTTNKDLTVVDALPEDAKVDLMNGPPTIIQDELFGRRVVVNGDTAIISALKTFNSKTTATDSVYVLRRQNSKWSFSQELNPDFSNDQGFGGGTIALDNNALAIGAGKEPVTQNGSAYEPGSGRVYFYTRVNAQSPWTLQQKLDGGNVIKPKAFFGGTLALKENKTLIVGAYLDDNGGNDRGSVYVYTWNSVKAQWNTPPAILLNNSAALLSDQGQFGYVIALADDLIAVGSPKDDNTISDSGAAYVFRFTKGVWQFEQKLKASTPKQNAGFGTSVAVMPPYLFVGAPNESGASCCMGAVYVFEAIQGSWKEIHKITLTPQQKDDFFGIDISTSGDNLLVAAYQQRNLSASANETEIVGNGSVFIFTKSGTAWKQTAKLTQPDHVLSNVSAATGAFFGWSSFLDGDTAIVGAPKFNGQRGAAYIFQINPLRQTDSWTLQAELPTPFK